MKTKIFMRRRDFHGMEAEMTSDFPKDFSGPWMIFLGGFNTKGVIRFF